MTQETILVTGANGFVGTHLCTVLRTLNYSVRLAVRSSTAFADMAGIDWVQTGEIGKSTDWKSALDGVHAVVHLAARVHVLREQSSDPLSAFCKVNAAGTERLARQSAEAGIRRLVYISSIKASAATTTRPQLESDTAVPDDAYGRSKLEAEQILHELAPHLDSVIIRPPLVYGPGVRANFLRLMKAVNRGVPLPLGGLDNRRSIVSVFNLCDLICRCLEHGAAAGQVFNVSDGIDPTVPELVRALSKAMNRSARLFHVPTALTKLVLRSVGRAEDFDRLFGSLQLDIGKAEQLLEWTPPMSMELALKQTVDWYLARN